MEGVTAPVGRPRRVGLLVTIGLLSAFGPFGTDMYLPAMPQLAAELGAGDVETQLTLVAYLVGLGGGQLFWGPLSDRIGRRGPILIGTIGYIAASIACAIAPTAWLLVAVRLAQGILGSAGIVVGRAVVRDLYEGDELARIFSRLTIVFGIAPIIAPVIGAGLLTFTDWRGTFLALALLGAILSAAALLLVPDTLDPAHRIHGRSPEMREAWRALPRSPRFLRYGGIGVIAQVGLLAYISMISLVLQGEWGLDATAFSLWFAVNSIGSILGGQAGGWLVHRIAPRRMLPVSIAASAVAGAIVTAAALLGGPFWLLEIGLFLCVLSFFVGTPLTTALALEPFHRGAGTAAAVMGSAQFVVGSIAPILIALAFGTTTLVMGATMLGAAAVALLVAVLPAARRG